MIQDIMTNQYNQPNIDIVIEIKRAIPSLKISFSETLIVIVFNRVCPFANLSNAFSWELDGNLLRRKKKLNY